MWACREVSHLVPRSIVHAAVLATCNIQSGDLLLKDSWYSMIETRVASRAETSCPSCTCFVLHYCMGSFSSMLWSTYLSSRVRGPTPPRPHAPTPPRPRARTPPRLTPPRPHAHTPTRRHAHTLTHMHTSPHTNTHPPTHTDMHPHDSSRGFKYCKHVATSRGSISMA